MTITTKEMLARIDERTLEIEKKLDEFSSSLGKVSREMDAVREKVLRIDARTLEAEKRTAELFSGLEKVGRETEAVRENINREISGVKEKTNEHDIVLYGRGGREGLVRKVERHDKAFWKAVGIGGFLMLALEFLKGWIK